MEDRLGKTHKGCGGTFVEVNIWEDIECDKCGKGVERYKYTKKEKIANLEKKNRELIQQIEAMQELLEKITTLAKQRLT